MAAAPASPVPLPRRKRGDSLVVAAGDDLARNRLADDFACAIRATPAARRYAECHLQILERARAERDRAADFAVGDGIADADVHSGNEIPYARPGSRYWLRPVNPAPPSYVIRGANANHSYLHLDDDF